MAITNITLELGMCSLQPTYELRTRHWKLSEHFRLQPMNLTPVRIDNRCYDYEAMVKAKQSHYSPGVTQRVPRS